MGQFDINWIAVLPPALHYFALMAIQFSQLDIFFYPLPLQFNMLQYFSEHCHVNFQKPPFPDSALSSECNLLTFCWTNHNLQEYWFYTSYLRHQRAPK